MAFSKLHLIFFGRRQVGEVGEGEGEGEGEGRGREDGWEGEERGLQLLAQEQERGAFFSSEEIVAFGKRRPFSH